MVVCRERLLSVLGQAAVGVAMGGLGILYLASPEVRSILEDWHSDSFVLLALVGLVAGPGLIVSATQAATCRVVLDEEGVTQFYLFGSKRVFSHFIAWSDVSSLEVWAGRSEIRGVRIAPEVGKPIVLGLWDTGLRDASVMSGAKVPRAKWGDGTTEALNRIASGAK